MLDRCRHGLLCSVILLLISMELIAEETVIPEKKDWKVGVALFATDTDDLSLMSISSVLGRLIYDDLSQIRSHVLSYEERLSIAEKALEEKKLKHIQALDKHYSSRDALFFDPNAKPTDISKVQKTIITEHKALEQIQNMSPLKIPVPASRGIVFPEIGDGSTLWSLDETIPEIFREKHEFDILITGNIVRVGEYYGITAYAWMESGQKVLWEGAADNAELEDVAQAIASEARGFVLGRSWTSLRITVEPPSGIISVNGEFVGVGYWADGTLIPGSVTIEVSAQGHKPVIQRKKLLAGQHTEVSIAMESVETNHVLVRSIPSGASVYLGSLWLGLTPLSVDVFDKIMPLTLKRDGYRNRTVPFSPETERLTVLLHEDLIDPRMDMDNARRKFNNSALWFSLSLAPTLILLGMSQNYLSMVADSTSQADIQSFDTAYKVTTGAAVGSLALNAGLLIVTLVRLSRFLKAAENLTD